MAIPPGALRQSVVARLLGRMRFPTLFKLAALLFVVDLLVPDLIPFLDELLLGAVTLLIGAWRERHEPAHPEPAKPVEKNITPRS